MKTKTLTNAALMMMFAGIENGGSLDVSILGITSRHVIFEIKPRVDPNMPPNMRLSIQHARGYLVCAQLAKIDLPVDKDCRVLGPWLWAEGQEGQRVDFANGDQWAWVRAYWPDPAVDIFSLVLQHYYLATHEKDKPIPIVCFRDGTPVESTLPDDTASQENS